MGRFPRGEREWEGFVELAQPLQFGGMDRRAFFLVLTISYAVYTAISFLVALLFFIIFFGSMRYLTRVDPHIITVLGAAAAHPHSWYDYDAAPSHKGYGPVVDPPMECWPHRP